MSTNDSSSESRSVGAVLHGTLAASVTPLLSGGERLDEDAFGPLVDRYAAARLDGILAFGTNGEGVLFSVDERRRGLRLFVEAAAGRLDVAAHCGAQTTADTVALAADAAAAGAAAVAVIGPPYFPLDEPAQLAHFAAAAAACAPLPFYVYEFARTSGYAVALDVLQRLRDEAPNFVGMKVSDAPWEAFEPYLSLGVDVFVGPEALIHRGIEGGCRRRRVRARVGVPGTGRRRRPRAERRRRGVARRAPGGGRAVPAAGRDEADPRGPGSAGEAGRPRAPSRPLGGRGPRARRLARLVVAGAARQPEQAPSSTSSTPGRRPSRPASASSSSEERWAPISSSHVAACVHAARVSTCRPSSVITA